MIRHVPGCFAMLLLFIAL